MRLFLAFLPHILGLAGALVIMALGWRTQSLWLWVSLLLYGLLFLGAVGLTPDNWLRTPVATDANQTAKPRPTTAVLLGFGYEMAGNTLQPGQANQFLLDWVLKNQPQITTLLAQEGVIAAMSPALFQEKTVRRIHRHDPAIYVDTLDAAFCAMQQLQQLKQESVLLVTHDLQLQRALWDFERVRQPLCPTCTFVIPDLPATPFPARSVQFQTRSAFVYKILELLYLRPRDLLRAPPTQCKAPIKD